MRDKKLFAVNENDGKSRKVNNRIDGKKYGRIVP